jgi:hypothetical protein
MASVEIDEDEVTVFVEAELRVRHLDAWMGVYAFNRFERHNAVRVRPR